MNYKLLVLLLLFVASNSFAQRTMISYYSPNPNKHIQKQLFAKMGNREYKLIDSSAACYAIIDIRDFNNDQFKDVLVANVQGCGGDCCGNSFFFFSYNPTKKQFIKTKEVGYDFRKSPDINKWKNRWSISVQSEHKIDSKEKDVFVLIGDRIVDPVTGKAVLADHSPPVTPKTNPVKPAKIEVIAQLNASQFDKNKSGLRKILRYDLNSDGKIDSIIASYVTNSGNGMQWQVNFGTGTIDQQVEAANSIGILNSKTNGFNRLLLNDFLVLYWNGQQYSTTPASELTSNNNNNNNTNTVTPVITTAPSAPRSLDFFYYKVKKKGESLSTIAQKHRSSVGAIKALNGKIRDLVKVGDSLKVPKKENAGFKIHVVEMNQTLWAISRKYNVSVDKIRTVNQLSNNTIKFGKIIRIPKA